MTWADPAGVTWKRAFAVLQGGQLYLFKNSDAAVSGVHPYLPRSSKFQPHFGRVGGRGAARAEDAQGTPTQSHISPSILINISPPFSPEKGGAGGCARAGCGAGVFLDARAPHSFHPGIPRNKILQPSTFSPQRKRMPGLIGLLFELV